MTIQEERSETERHWDQLCIATITIGIAVMAAVFFISGLGQERPEPLTLVAVLKPTLAGMLTTVYGSLVLQACVTIFRTKGPNQRTLLRNKRVNTASTFSFLGALIAGLGIFVFCVIIIPPDIPWRDGISRTIRVNDETWTKLECLTGTEGTADHKVSRALDYAEGPHVTRTTPEATLSSLLQIYPWFVCVQATNGELTVHLTEDTPEIRQTIPARWKDRTVTIKPKKP